MQAFFLPFFTALFNQDTHQTKLGRPQAHNEPERNEPETNQENEPGHPPFINLPTKLSANCHIRYAGAGLH